MSNKTLTAQQQSLMTKWDAIHNGSAQALSWLHEARATVPSVDAEANALNIKFYRARNLAKNLRRATATPMTVGFFGLSQAGKSYLISALAADAKGDLETEIANGQTLNFMDHFNPVGSGKEATGLVTRFTVQKQTVKDPTYPLQLRLFREIEIAMILSNAWFKDFDQEGVEFKISETLIQRVLAPYDNIDTSRIVPGVSAEDIVALMDYLHVLAKNSVGKLDAHYWPRLIKIAPYLSIAQRAEVFSILWGQQALLSQTYVQLSRVLHQLGLCEAVVAPVDVLIKEQGGSLVQENSIMNVDTLNLLLTQQDIPVQVRPLVNAEPGNPVSVLTAQLAALTTEIVFPLASAPKAEIVEEVDLLDFPGYRTRQQLLNIEDAREVGSDASPVARLFLRGKVAYLFERYTTSQEMNALVMCTSSFKQSEVVTVGPVLSDWIHKTQGASPEERKGRCGLIWALTMMDGFIGNALNLKPEQMPEAAENMLKLTMMERFGNLPWMQEWEPGQAFNNTFLVRKPRLQTSFINLDSQDNEESLVVQNEAKLAALRNAFVQTPATIRHVAQPEVAWDSMLSLNDGGIGRFSSSVSRIADLGLKLQRIEEQWQQLNKSLGADLRRWYQADGEAALTEKNNKARLILGGLGQDARSIAELMHYMAIPEEVLRDLYLSGMYEADPVDDSDEGQVQTATPAPLYGDDGGFDFGDLFSAAGADTEVAVADLKPKEKSGKEHRFAKAVFSAWIAHLRNLPEQTAVLAILFRKPETVSVLIDEIIIASYRYGLQEKIVAALMQYSSIGNRRERTVDKQVLIVQLVLQDYIAWLGNLDKAAENRSKRLKDQPGAVFDFYSQQCPEDLPVLSEKAAEQGRNYLFDWLSAVFDLTINNAGHNQGREITLEQNNNLGLILENFKAS
ncbi:MAG: virulence factor SrfC family protein [Advenella sp.]|nr:virulence factor SrfC family protein [Advenella sp.]